MLTTGILRQLYPAADQANIESFAAQAATVLPEFGISQGRNRLHFFLAQLGHESDGLRAREENLNYSARRLMAVWPSRFPDEASTAGFARNPEALANKVYGGRMGNDQPGDGWKYRGRGYIQITGRDGYRQVGARANIDLEGRPELALDPQHGLRIACGFWAWKNINPLCDSGDFVGVTRKINGGTVGLQDRFEWLAKVQAIVAWPPGGTAPGPSGDAALSTARLKAAQITLQSLGLYDGSIDGIFGKRSRAGLKLFQLDNNLRPTGKLDHATLDALGV